MAFIQKNPNDLLTFYDKKEYQVFRHRSVDGEPATVIYASDTELIPFQILSSTNLGDPVSFQLFNESDTKIADLDISLITKTTTDQGYFYTYNGSDIGIQLDCGQRFYISLRFLPKFFYSDLMTAIDITNPDTTGGSGTVG